MSLGTGTSLAELDKIYGTHAIDNTNYIGPRLDCFPPNRLDPRDLFPITDKHFKEINTTFGCNDPTCSTFNPGGH